MKIGLGVAMMCALLIAAVATRPMAMESGPRDLYMERLEAFSAAQQALATTVSTADLSAGEGRAAVTADIAACRRKLKSLDFWFRYLEPIAYKRLNGPLPVEWETEVFEKWEPPYRREGAGLTLAELHLGEDDPQRDVLQSLMAGSALAVATFAADSITRHLDSFSPFFLCNRLYLLNLATIYTTGFECPAPERVIPELLAMLADVAAIYQAHNQAFPDHALSPAYLILYARMVIFVEQQPQDIARFDHYTFVRDYVNPLFGLNQGMIVDHGVASESYQDYTLSDTVGTIFDKGLFFAQDPKGIYRRIQDEGLLSEIAAVGKLLFYDPILSGNQQRSCASCHRQETYFTDTRVQTALQLDRQTRLPRNTPSLLNVVSHHLLMLDGKHLDLQSQATAVIANPIELGGEKATVLKEILSCPTYQKAFQKFQRATPLEPELGFDHVVSAITLYYGGFSRFNAPLDDAMNGKAVLDSAAVKGYNLFMGKAQCGTCHFAPTFSGIKPPYIGNEFEVIGVPADSNYRALSADAGRHAVHAALETLHAFRTGTLRNAAHTAPYMHNGSLPTLASVIDLYDHGGGRGKSLAVDNQTLAADSLHLTPLEKQQLIAFIHSLTEDIPFEDPPTGLPKSRNPKLNARKVGGEY